MIENEREEADKLRLSVAKRDHLDSRGASVPKHAAHAFRVEPVVNTSSTKMYCRSGITTASVAMAKAFFTFLSRPRG